MKSYEVCQKIINDGFDYRYVAVDDKYNDSFSVLFEKKEYANEYAILDWQNSAKKTHMYVGVISSENCPVDENGKIDWYSYEMIYTTIDLFDSEKFNCFYVENFCNEIYNGDYKAFLEDIIDCLSSGNYTNNNDAFIALLLDSEDNKHTFVDYVLTVKSVLVYLWDSILEFIEIPDNYEKDICTKACEIYLWSIIDEEDREDEIQEAIYEYCEK